MTLYTLVTRALFPAAAALLAACQPVGAPMTLQVSQPASYPKVITEAATRLAALDVPTKATKAKPKITGVGFSSVAGQPGKTLNARRLMAVKAAKLEALRDLTEQVHGVRIKGSITVGQAVVRNDVLQGTVSGTIRGARTVSITPKGSDTYEVVMELDYALVKKMLRDAKKWAN